MGDKSTAPVGLDPEDGFACDAFTPSAKEVRLTRIHNFGCQFLKLKYPELVAGSYDDLVLSSSPHPGVQQWNAGDADKQLQIKLVKPLLRLDLKSGNITGTAVLSVPSDYLPAGSPPSEIPVSISSTTFELSSTPLTVRGQANYGPLEMQFKFNLRYDPQLFLKAVTPAARRTVTAVANATDTDEAKAAARAGAEEAAKAALDVAQHPGFDISALTTLALPIIGRVPINKFTASAASTKPLDHPLPGAPTAFPMSFRTYGLIPTPPGSLFDVQAIGGGYRLSNYSATSGTSLTIAGLPTLSPDAIGAGAPFLKKFPIYGYLEYYHVERVSSGVDLGVRITVSPSTADLYPDTSQKDSLQQYRDFNSGHAEEPKKLINFQLEAHF